MAVRMRATLREDRSGIQALKRALSPRNSKSIKIGWWGDIHSNGITTAQIASWNEQGHWSRGMYGPAYTPPRPFMRVGWEPRAKQYVKDLDPQIREVLLGRKRWEDLYNGVGEDLTEMVQEVILDWKTPPNTLLTEELKGFNDPLIEHGIMYDSVKFKIDKFSKGGE